MASVVIQVPSPRPQGAESLLMTLGTALTPKRSPASGGSAATNGRAISRKMSEIAVNNSGNQINSNSINLISLKAERPDLTGGPGGQTN